MKKLLDRLTTPIVGSLIAYAIAAVTCWSFNPVEWSSLARYFTALSIGILVLLTVKED